MLLKLVYFQVRAKAEPPRMALAYGGLPWTDESCASYYGCSWPEAKPKTPWGSLPILSVDGTEFAQMPAIMRFVASMVNKERPGFFPSEPLAAAVCDSVFCAAEELSTVNPCVNVWKGDDFTAKKAEYFKVFNFKIGKSAHIAPRS